MLLELLKDHFKVFILISKFLSAWRWFFLRVEMRKLARDIQKVEKLHKHFLEFYD